MLMGSSTLPRLQAVLAAMVADAPADAGEGVVLLDHAQRVIVAPLADERDVALGALVAGQASRQGAMPRFSMA
jgi:hypothetical protein